MDAAPVLEASEEVFDPVSLSVEDGIVGKAPLVVAVRGNAGSDPAGTEGLSEPVAVIGPVGEQDGSVRQIRSQNPGADMIVALTFGEEQAQGSTPPIAQDVQLGRQPTPTASDSAG